MDSRIYAAIDANINRSLEGIRVCEDIFRFVARNKVLSVKLKDIRHNIADAIKAFSYKGLLSSRDVDNDSQKFVDLDSEKKRDNLQDILKSNLHRAMEAMRSVEEFYKLLHAKSDENPFQKIRFSLYSIEKELISCLIRNGKHKKFKNSLYAILDSSFVKNEEYLNAAQRLIKGGASIIQLRMKNHSQGKILEVAKEISGLCKENNVLLIINDYPDIAYLSGADGVHLGQDDLPVIEVRRLFPMDMIIGISTHSREQAVVAARCEPDYIAIGPVYNTKTKNNQNINGIGEDVVREVSGGTDIPVVAIGGLNPERIGILKTLRCGCYAVVSYLYKDDKIEDNCRGITGIL
ncbi:MAG: thiamine phosphate synthase [Spirochaetota bacterium]